MPKNWDNQYRIFKSEEYSFDSKLYLLTKTKAHFILTLFILEIGTLANSADPDEM